MKISEILNAVSSLAGVGPATATLLANLNIFTVSDLLQYYPRDYEDRTKRISLADAYRQNVKAHTIAQVVAHDWFGYGRMKTLKLIVTDGTLQAELVAFNRAFLEKSLPVGSIIAVTGKFEEKYGRLQCTGFDAEKIADGGTVDAFAGQPVPNSAGFPRYHLTEGLSQKTLAKAVGTAIAKYALGIENELPDELIARRGLLPKAQAIRQIHQPKTMQEAADARTSLVYEELFLFQKTLAARALAHRGTLPALDPHEISRPAQPPVSPDEFAQNLSPRQKQLLASLPFPLTDDQRAVIAQMNDDIDKNYAASQKNTRPFAMRTLLQGDVGSGKTLAAFFVCLRVIDYGSQCAFMAPTEILARQHAENAARQLESLHVRVAYLTGNVTAAGRRQLLDALKAGEIDLVIGTHALFSKQVQYHDLALAVIDEQHRFGVMQRSAIIDKGRTSTDAVLREPNLLMMSATPIPQTLALTVFGDLDVRSIHTMPGGRKQIQTYLVRQGNERNAYEAVRKELRAGHQAYFVYPAIEKQFFDRDESGASKTALKSAEENFAFLSRQVYPECTVALIHGNIDEDTQNRILTDFRAGNIQILVATSVVEVGVDVPNATCMVIEQADRFGLAALHQLRGRVGRGDAQSFCFLIYSAKLTETGIARMKILRESTDGFAIAEEDLRLRGPGEITGTAQSGELTFAIADPVRDKDIMLQARADAFRYAT
ncbi:MAG: ATP-dependent DNA helicase RecG [Treponemataceae bacterium]|nr:ATP-dependent DNA helicase RecG [Treponemataceae bacterium]